MELSIVLQTFKPSQKSCKSSKLSKSFQVFIISLLSSSFITLCWRRALHHRRCTLHLNLRWRLKNVTILRYHQHRDEVDDGERQELSLFRLLLLDQLGKEGKWSIIVHCQVVSQKLIKTSCETVKTFTKSTHKSI